MLSMLRSAMFHGSMCFLLSPLGSTEFKHIGIAEYAIDPVVFLSGNSLAPASVPFIPSVSDSTPILPEIVGILTYATPPLEYLGIVIDVGIVGIVVILSSPHPPSLLPYAVAVTSKLLWVSFLAHSYLFPLLLHSFCGFPPFAPYFLLILSPLIWKSSFPFAMASRSKAPIDQGFKISLAIIIVAVIPPLLVGNRYST